MTWLTGVAGRFQEYGVMIDVRVNTGRLGLKGLRPAYLGATNGNKRVERHVLRLKRRYFFPPLIKYPAESRRKEALAYVRGGPLNHDLLNGGNIGGPIH